ncbi:MAG TPA: aspartate-semialdehyde dehydrogenase [Anaeromyxobacter sp.]|nr:aspartate-semialdehyde dehydrogenase [Anaeromyxobacter sp.]
MPSRPVSLAVVGATGALGRATLQLLPDADLDPSELRLLASERSQDERLEVDGEALPVGPLSAEALRGVDLALFLAPPAVAREWAPRAWAAGCAVVDASPAFRGDPEVPLVAPRVNLEAAAGFRRRGVVAVASGAAAALAPAVGALAGAAGVEGLIAAVLAPAAGAGRAGTAQLEKEASDLMNGREPEPGRAVPHRLAYNVVPQVGSFLPDGRTDEEASIESDLRRLLEEPTLWVRATAVRVPVFHGLTVLARILTTQPLSAKDARAALRDTAGQKLVDDPGQGIYPMPMLSLNDDGVLLGRVRADEGNRSVDFVVTVDELTGAAASALRIAERIAGAL